MNDVQANKSGALEVVKEIKSLGRKAIPYLADVSKLKEVECMVETSVAELGPLDTMIANAGIAQVRSTEHRQFKRFNFHITHVGQTSARSNRAGRSSYV